MPLSIPDLIVPTFNNPQYLLPMLSSVYSHKYYYPMNIIVVNNGHPGIVPHIPKVPEIRVIQAPDNLGWEGGLKLGLKHSNAKFIGLINDDIFVPTGSYNWLRLLMGHFSMPDIGAVGPTSNCVMGPQQIFIQRPEMLHYVQFLIGFCALYRREALEKAGGIDETLPGGDDLDLSIRLRDAGYNLLCDRRAFVYHHGFKTGERVRGTPDQPGGWNSSEMTERTNNALIRKHGFRKWYELFFFEPKAALDHSDIEGDCVRERVKPGTVLELGCGGVKTVPHAIGMDFYAKGEPIPTVKQNSVADIQGDVTKIPESIGKFDNIIARHIIEHCVDIVATLKHWKSFLNPGGRLIIAVPDEDVDESLPTNPEHKHAFTPESLGKLMALLDFENLQGFKGRTCVVSGDAAKAEVLQGAVVCH